MLFIGELMKHAEQYLSEGLHPRMIVEGFDLARAEVLKFLDEFKISPQTEQRNPKGKIWTHPVISNGKLYLRDQELLFCYSIKG